MILLQLNVRNPFSNRFKCIANPVFQITQHKFIELQFDQTTDIVAFEFRVSTRQDHAGVFISLGLVGYEAIFNFYDCRHWDYDNGEWIKNEQPY